MVNLTEKKAKYTEGMFFQIRITSRYMSIAGAMAFEKLNIGMPFDSYLILDIISYNEGICHIDLAKMLFRDRSNIGKTVSSLEKKKLVKIKPDIRNNRVIKKIYVTEKGKKLCKDIYCELAPYWETLYDSFSDKEQETIIKQLGKCRHILDNMLKKQEQELK